MLPTRKFSGPVKGSFSLVKGTQVLRKENGGTEMEYTHTGFSAVIRLQHLNIKFMNSMEELESRGYDQKAMWE